MDDWEKLKEDEQYFIKHVLAFFAASDGIVNGQKSKLLIQTANAPIPLFCEIFAAFEVNDWLAEHT